MTNSPYLESDLLPSQLHSFDFEVNSYEGDENHTCEHVKLPAFPVWILFRSPLSCLSMKWLHWVQEACLDDS